MDDSIGFGRLRLYGDLYHEVGTDFGATFAEKEVLFEEAEPLGRWEYVWLEDDGGLKLMASVRRDGAYDVPFLEDKKVREKCGGLIKRTRERRENIRRFKMEIEEKERQARVKEDEKSRQRASLPSQTSTLKHDP